MVKKKENISIRELVPNHLKYGYIVIQVLIYDISQLELSTFSSKYPLVLFSNLKFLNPS